MENCSIKPTELSHCQLTELHHLPKGSFLYQQGEAAHEFYYVQAGLIGLFHTLENGKESLVRLYSKGDYFGFRTLFSMTDKPADCICMLGIFLSISGNNFFVCHRSFI